MDITVHLTYRQTASRLLAVMLVPGLLMAQSSAPLPVTVTLPESRQAVQQVELTGSFNARNAASLSPRLSGLVQELLVDAGDRVAAGDVLVRLDDRLAVLELAQAASALRQAQASLAEAERLRDEALRLKDSAVLPATEISARESALAIARAAVAVAQAQRDTQAERVQRHKVVAPFAGVISQRLSDPGEWVQIGTAVVELVDVNDLWLDVQAPQRLWPLLGAAPAVEVTVDALGDRVLAAQVAARVPVSDPAARTFLLRLTLADRSADITPGMSARVRLSLPGAQRNLIIPRDALIRYPDGTTTVWVVDTTQSPPRANQRQVQLVGVSGNSAEIVSGLAPDQPVVVRGNEVLTEGQAVRVIDAGSD